MRFRALPTLIAAISLLVFINPSAQAATVTYSCGTSGTFSVDNVTNTVTGHTSCVGNLTIPEGVVAIGTSAFSSNANLGAISIPASMRTIGTSAFYGTTFTSITFAEGTTTISSNAFSGSAARVAMYLPNSVTSIGDRAFEQSQFTSYSFGPNVTLTGNTHFYNNFGQGSTSVEFRGGSPNITTIPSTAFVGYRGGEITLPVNITSIEARAFEGAGSLRYLIVPDSVTTIGQQALTPTSSLKYVILPNALTTLGATVFGSGLSAVIYCGSTSAVQNYAYPNSVVPTCGKGVIYEANGGSGSMAMQVRTTSGTLTPNTFTRSGYAFAGWNTKANGTGTSYSNAATYNFASHKVLYAQWVVPDVTAPTFLTSTSISLAENYHVAGDIATNESTTITITGGIDQSLFSVNRVTDTITALKFLDPPNFEDARDSDTNNTYLVTLTATDSSGNTQAATFTVTVTDVAEVINLIASTVPKSYLKGISSNISLTFDNAAKVTIFYNGKKVARCINLLTGSSSPFQVTCAFKSAIRGSGVLMVAVAPPSGANLSSNIPLGSVAVVARSGTR